MSAPSLISHIRGRDGYTRCGLVWVPATSGTLTLCPVCRACSEAAALAAGARPL